MVILLQARHDLRHLRQDIRLHSAQAVLRRHVACAVQSVRPVVRIPGQDGVPSTPCSGWPLVVVDRDCVLISVLLLVWCRAQGHWVMDECFDIPLDQQRGTQSVACPGQHYKRSLFACTLLTFISFHRSSCPTFRVLPLTLASESPSPPANSVRLST